MISVCLATFNGERFIKQQIDSILLQLEDNDELIISDDGSMDATINILNLYKHKDNRITVFYNNFKNVVKNFEFLIDKASGDIIFLSDQDDIWDNSKVCEYKKAFINNPNTSLVIGDLELINENNEPQGSFFKSRKFKKNIFNNIIRNNFIGCSLAFKKEIKKNILPFPKSTPMHDWWIGICSLVFGEVTYIDKKLTYYRRHQNNFTKGGASDFITKFLWRMKITLNLIVRFLNF